MMSPPSEAVIAAFTTLGGNVAAEALMTFAIGSSETAHVQRALTALVDVFLYLLMPECETCYRCCARYRGAGGHTEGFDLETHEKHRQQRLRLSAHAAASRPPSPT